MDISATAVNPVTVFLPPISTVWKESWVLPGRNLGSEIPGHDDDVVGPLLFEPLDGMLGNVCAGQKPAVLVRVTIDGELDQVRADPTVVE